MFQRTSGLLLESTMIAFLQTPSRRDRRGRRPGRRRSGVGLRPRVDLLEQRALLSALPTLTALSASADSGASITFTATVSDLSAGGAAPNGGTVTFSDQAGTIGTGTLADGVATYTTSGLSAGTITVSASYGGTASFAPSTTGTIVTAVGDGKAGNSGNNGPATKAELNGPWGVAVDSAGDLFICDENNNTVREVVKATGDITTVAGDGTAGYSGDGGLATKAELDVPNGVAVDSAGDLFISDANNNRIREVMKATGDIMTIAGDGKAGYTGDGGPATAAEIDSPRGLAVDSAGDVFFADNPNNVVREVKATGDITTVAGDGKAGSIGDGGPATKAELNGPNDVAVDSAGNLYIGDVNTNTVREVVQATGNIIAFAGDGKAGDSGAGGPATAAELSNPNGVAFDSAGDAFIADGGDNVVWEVVKATGDIITVAGNGTDGYSGDNGPATDAEIQGDGRLAVDPAGEVFIVDNGNNVVREFTTALTVTVTPSPTPTPTPTTPTPTPTPTTTRTKTSSSTVFQNGTPNPDEPGSLTPTPAVSPLFVTRTFLAVRPRSPRSGQPVTLMATVKPIGGPQDGPRAPSLSWMARPSSARSP